MVSFGIKQSETGIGKALLGGTTGVIGEHAFPLTLRFWQRLIGRE
jgi:hypothetical protein